MSTNHERGKKAEEFCKKWLENSFKDRFSKKNLPVGFKKDGKIAQHSFDLVSSDNQVVAEVKSHQITKGGNNPSGKIADTYYACSMLEKVKSNRKLLLLTDEQFYNLFKRYSDGKIAEDIEIIQVNIPVDWNCIVVNKFDDLTTFPNMAFEDFWQELAEYLSNEREISNWTKDKGYFGENFLAGPLLGNYVTVKAPSATVIQKVPKRDFKIIYEKWKDYLNGIENRGNLAKDSRFTKYTISIIHELLDKS
ncbi:MAG: hypothetical protein NWE96_04330 [Candidatus Bathyarchaeota archaeon]|nr:hypothetical protein [Candidatus Bathyarchaeota archaeon]